MSSYFDFNSKQDREFAPYSSDASLAPVKTVEGYTAADFQSLVDSMNGNRNNKHYDMSSNLLYNPSDPEYIPTLREAAIEDKNQLIVQQNTMFALSVMSAVSVAVVLFMIGNRK